jgi:CTP synthase
MEFSADTPHPVIDLMEEQKSITDMGGTMRLGAYPCTLQADTRARAAYDAESISERHRHRYEVNNAYRDKLQEGGLTVAGVNEASDLVEMVEWQEHPWYVACQFHPEFQSTPLKAHPLFREFVAAALARRDSTS